MQGPGDIGTRMAIVLQWVERHGTFLIETHAKHHESLILDEEIVCMQHSQLSLGSRKTQRSEVIASDVTWPVQIVVCMVEV